MIILNIFIAGFCTVPIGSADMGNQSELPQQPANAFMIVLRLVSAIYIHCEPTIAVNTVKFMEHGFQDAQ